jgi:hypothetical protein
MSAGALNVYSSSAIEALHKGLSKWTSPHVRASALIRILSELDTHAQAGLFLALFLGSPANTWTFEETVEVLSLALADTDVRDLAGEPRHVLDSIPDYAEEVQDALMGGTGSSDSEADSQGNLDGFIAYTDEEEEDGEDGDDDDDEDGDGSSDESEEVGARGRARPAPAAAKRGRLRRTAAGSDSSSGDDEDGGGGGKASAGARKRGRPSGSGGRGRGRAEDEGGKGSSSKRTRYLDLEAGMG